MSFRQYHQDNIVLINLDYFESKYLVLFMIFLLRTRLDFYFAGICYDD